MNRHTHIATHPVGFLGSRMHALHTHATDSHLAHASTRRGPCPCSVCRLFCLFLPSVNCSPSALWCVFFFHTTSAGECPSLQLLVCRSLVVSQLTLTPCCRGIFATCTGALLWSWGLLTGSCSATLSFTKTRLGGRVCSSRHSRQTLQRARYAVQPARHPAIPEGGCSRMPICVSVIVDVFLFTNN